ncbi:hypothetical protein L596_020772 [Steinernema carpocapsae]|uniref:Dynamin GTPase n=1 Tax=Steinernema carpocapsae TaxID=34508 RepID=A0A4U5MUQ8_STECR|nr:hypothetical protein L596_020772 [Steinernema carpocapsae]
MILSFIEKENCLILAVSPANADLATSDAIKLAQKVDPAGDRTIGVLSKLDLMDPGTDAREILENKKEPGSVYLKRGYIGVVNRSQKDIQGGKTLAEALAAERDFFLDHSAYQHIADIHGTDYLRNYLNKELTKHIKERMPSVVERIKTTAALLEKELKMYHEKPDDVRGFTRLAAHMMNLVVDEFQKRMGDVSSRLDSVDLNERCLGSIIRNVFQKNFEQHIESSLSIEDIELRHTILMARENTNGLRAGFFTSAKVFETIVEDQIGRLAQPALEAVDEVVVELDGAIRNMLRSMSQFPALERFACGKSIQKLGENKGKAHDYINTLLRVEKAYVETKHRTSQDHSETEDDILWKNKDGKGSAIYDGCPYQKIQLDKKQLLLYNNSKDLKDTDHHVALDLDKCFMRVHHAMNKKVQLKSDLETVTFNLTNEDTVDLIAKLCSIGFYPEVSETGKRVRDDVEDLYLADKKVVRQVEQVYDMIRDYMDVVIRSIWSYVPKIVIALVIDEQVKYFKVDLLSDIVNEGIKLLEEAPTLAKDRRMKQRKLDTCSKVLEVCKQLEHLSV